MQNHKIITPRFYSQFACRGSDCIDNCCHSWNISIDKKTHKKYEKSTNAKIRQLSKENLIQVRGGKDNYSMVRLNSEGYCPFLDGKGLCMIHANMGPQALSHTCINFPRLKKSFADQTCHSMTMACSEVVRLVLFNADSMLLSEENRLLPQSQEAQRKAQHRDQRGQLINLLFCHLAMADSPSVEANLFAMINLILYLQKIDFAIEARFTELESFFQSLLAALVNGELSHTQHHNQHSSPFKVTVLTLLGTAITETRRGAVYLINNHVNIANFLQIEKSDAAEDLSARFSLVNEQWQRLCADSCLSAPYVLRNFILYQLYNRNFPQGDSSTLFHQFYRIMIDYFYLKTSLSVMSLNKPIEPDDVIRLVSYYHVIYEHNKNLKEAMDKHIKDINFNDYLSCLFLLD